MRGFRRADFRLFYMILKRVRTAHRAQRFRGTVVGLAAPMMYLSLMHKWDSPGWVLGDPRNIPPYYRIYALYSNKRLQILIPRVQGRRHFRHFLLAVSRVMVESGSLEQERGFLGFCSIRLFRPNQLPDIAIAKIKNRQCVNLTNPRLNRISLLKIKIFPNTNFSPSLLHSYARVPLTKGKLSSIGN